VKATYTGAGPAYELLIGGTIAKGFVLGGGFVGQDITNPSVALDMSGPVTASEQLTAQGSLGVGALGPFVDWFPDDTGGFHAGAMVGFGIIGLGGGSGGSRDSGLGGSLWAGYDFWISDQWSLGAEGRAAAASGKRTFGYYDTSLNPTDSNFNDSGATYELLFTALYH